MIEMVKRKKANVSIMLIALLQIFWSCAPKNEQIVINPKEIDDPLVNPGRGFATTGIYNEDIGERLHPLSGVIQKRWYWDELEPIEGEIRFPMIDSIISKAVKNGQQLNIRIMCQNVKMRIPEWAMEQGVKPPYYDNPVFLKKQENLIKAFADRYDGDPDIAFFDIGTVGQWGEWHTSSSGVKMPSDQNVLKIIDFYLNNFKKTPLVMLIGGAKGPGLAYAIKKGAGWRADCWGDMGDNWKHMEEFYPEALESSNAYDAWKKAPIALETCWTMEEWHKQGWDIDYILSKALEWHTTEVNNGSEGIPPEWWPKVKEFEKKLGYRFVLRQLEYPSIVSTGDYFNYSMIWENKGVAPIYQRYPLVFLFQSEEDSTKAYAIETEEDITKWMPGLSSNESKIEIPENITAGNYNIYIGLIGKESKKPAIRLAIEGRTSDGWYQLGNVQFKR
jgi:hypothetical protein